MLNDRESIIEVRDDSRRGVRLYLTNRAWTVEESATCRAGVTFWTNDFGGIGGSSARFFLGWLLIGLRYVDDLGCGIILVGTDLRWV